MAVITSVAVPERLTPGSVRALLGTVRETSARALVLRGASSGVDLDCVDDWSAADSDAFRALLTGLRDSRLVTVAVVDGVATGGGVGLAAACDFVVATPGAGFRLTEALVGLVPALIWPFLAARMGAGAVFRAAVVAAWLDADDAVRLGLADEVVADAEAWVRELGRALRRMPRDVVGDLKACRRGMAPEDAYELFRKAVADPAVRRRLAAVAP